MHNASASLRRAMAAVQRVPVTVFSDRTMSRDLMVDFLRRHGFPQANGRSSGEGAVKRGSGDGRALAFVDLESEASDARELLRELRTQRPVVTTVAFGTPMQLAANAQEADGWLELSEPAASITKVARAAARSRQGALKGRSTAATQRLARTWRTLTGRQRQVLALLGCGLDNQRLAVALGLSERAVKAHVSALLDKFRADSRTELALIAAHAGVHSSLADFPFR